MPDAVPSGLSHMTFVVSDLDAMEAILVGVLGAQKVYDSGAETFSLSEERFFLVGADRLWIAAMKGEPLAARTYNHVAFKVDEADIESYRSRIAALGLEVRESRPRVDGEGRSLYFYDRDNHLFELHTGTLAERLERYAEGRTAEPVS
jgi:fosfomycin resistance protein FosX